MIEAQDYTSLQPVQSQETPQDYNQGLETANTSHPTSCPKESYHRLTATASRPYKSPDWGPMSRVNTSGQPGLHSLRTLRSTI